jgi:hypothetical protein
MGEWYTRDTVFCKKTATSGSKGGNVDLGGVFDPVRLHGYPSFNQSGHPWLERLPDGMGPRNGPQIRN